ncbi:MAG: ribbon-helix-helix domain-containing protein [Deltaproteobacteria bacterium]|nr:ribbon-helix-helix domain-containing protein [Deltaproteobacteria bacterium]
MISLSLDPELENSIQRADELLGISKSELIRKSVADYLSKLSKPGPWELGKDYFGKYASGQTNLSADRKVLLKKRIMAKRK